MSELSERFETHDPGAKAQGEKLRCDACPVMCYIAEGRTGACDRYGNFGGRIVRSDPLVILEHVEESGGEVVPFMEGAEESWDGNPVSTAPRTAPRSRRSTSRARIRSLSEESTSRRDGATS